MRKDLFGDFAQSISSCTTLNGVREAFRNEVTRQGYTASACRAFVPTGADTKSTVLLFRNWTKDWAELSDQKGFSANSFVIAEARRRMTPFTWLDAKDARPLKAAEREVWSAVLSWGWNNGFVLPVHGPGGYFATVSMASPERDLDLGDDNRLHLQMIAMLAHERCHLPAKLASVAQPIDIMSARELECLRWVGRKIRLGDRVDPVDLGGNGEIPPQRCARKARGAHARAGGRSPCAGWIVLNLVERI